MAAARTLMTTALLGLAASTLLAAAEPDSTVERDSRAAHPSSAAVTALMTQLLGKGELARPAVIMLESPRANDMPSDVAPIGAITLPEALDMSRQRSDELKAQDAAAHASRWVARSTLGRYGPKLTAQYQRGREHSYSSGETAQISPIPEPSHTRTDQSVVLRQPLVDVAALAAYRRDDRLAEAESAKRSQTEVNVAFDVVTAYYQLVQFQLLVELGKEHNERMQSLLGYMTRRAEGGGASGADRERVRAMSLAVQRDLVDARSELAHAQMSFARLTGTLPSSLLVTQDKFALFPPTAEQATQQMVESNPQLLALRKQIEAAAFDRSSTRASMLPKVSLEVGDYRSTNASGIPGTTHDRRAMLVMTLDVLNGGSEYAMSQAQAQQQEQLRHQYDDTVRKARERLQTNYLNLTSIRAQMAIGSEENKANSQVAAAFDAQLVASNRSLLDVLDTYQKLYQNRINLVKLFVSERQATYQVLKDVGRIDAGDFDVLGP